MRTQRGTDKTFRDYVQDSYEDLDVADDIGGNGASQTVTLPKVHDLIVALAQGGDARLTGTDDTPTATHGVPLLEDTPTYLPFKTNAVKVFAAAGVTVTVYGMRYLDELDNP